MGKLKKARRRMNSPDWLPIYGAALGSLSLVLAVISLVWQIRTHYESPKIAAFGPQRLAGGIQYVPTRRDGAILYRVVLVNQRSKPISILYGSVSGTFATPRGTVAHVDNYEYTGFDRRQPPFPLTLAPGEATPVDLAIYLRQADGPDTVKMESLSKGERLAGDLTLTLMTGLGPVSPTVKMEFMGELIVGPI